MPSRLASGLQWAVLIALSAVFPLVVQTADPYSPLGLELAATLERAGIAPGVEGSPSAALKITAEEWTAPGAKGRSDADRPAATEAEVY